jgi:hypothetical protein
MNLYRIIAQSSTNARRVTKTLKAYRGSDVLQLVSGELESAGLYPISIEMVCHQSRTSK